jgi:hypothetical protein
MPFAAETEKKNFDPAKRERNFRGKVSLRALQPHFEHLTTAYCRNLGVQKKQEPKTK